MAGRLQLVTTKYTYLPTTTTTTATTTTTHHLRARRADVDLEIGVDATRSCYLLLPLWLVTVDQLLTSC